MKNYTSPVVVEYGKASELVQGCMGWGKEGFALRDSDTNKIYVWNGAEVQCVCGYQGWTC
ncbi:hypothetical protein [Caldalkalibacillus mannanilyticus]|uniref:hypothetical protein n=1 Tax=Caldalkalibacillus mannanilyticus TaxID=1418 RepID=UPI00046AB337|nr:hypothetical protein [Caldalkalibacillus mannanilyticus]